MRKLPSPDEWSAVGCSMWFFAFVALGIVVALLILFISIMRNVN